MRCLQINYSNICVKISILLLIHRYRGPPSPAGEGYTKNAFICFYSKKYFSALHFFRIHNLGIDKNAQNRQISVSLPYIRTAETDFGERKSEYNKNAGNPPRGLHAFLLIDISKSLSFHRCLYQIKTFTLHFFGLHFFSIPDLGIDKNAQNRQISVSSPYIRTAETDFGERKSEYNKNAGNPLADCMPTFK